MRLILTLAGGGLSANEKTRALSSGSLSIGRGPGNDWVLPDPGRTLSKTHCRISAEGGKFVLIDLSSNGIYIDGASQPTARDSRLALADGNSLRLGDYTIAVAVAADGAAAASGAMGGGLDPADLDLLNDPLGDDPLKRPSGSGFQHPIQPIAVNSISDDPFALIGQGPGGGQQGRLQTDDLLRGLPQAGGGGGGDSWHGAPHSDHASALSQAMPPQRVLPATQLLGDIDFDALIGDLGPAAPLGGPAALAPAPAHVVDLTPPPLPARPVDPVPAPVAVEPVPAEPPARMPTRAAPPAPADIPDPFAETSGQPAAIRASSPAGVAPAAAARAETAPARPQPAPASPEDNAASAKAAFAAFLEGAGMTGQAIDAADPEAALRAAGKVFRTMTEGLRDVLMARKSIKNELRVDDQTMISSGDNNALKFSLTPDDAVLSLLSRRKGYMSPLASTREAFHDIRSHELAVMAGIQTALLALLKRFDPDALEARLTSNWLGGVLPSARKARYWEAFRQTYGDISREAEDDFQAVFGRSFAEAYKARTLKE